MKNTPYKIQLLSEKQVIVKLKGINSFIKRIKNSKKDNMYIEQIKNNLSSITNNDEYNNHIIESIFVQSKDNLQMTIKMWGEDLVNDIYNFCSNKPYLEQQV